MENNDKKEFATLLWAFANDAGVKISKEQLLIKFESLKQFSINEISIAANHLLHYREKTWPAIPAISEFIKTIESKGPKSISIEDQAEIQAVMVIEKLMRSGKYSPIDFVDPITKSIMTDRWNYHKWAETVLESELVWWKKDFIILYKSYSKYSSAGLLIDAPGGKLIPVNDLKQLATQTTKRIEQ
jgi:hypothetical protein